MTPALFHSRSRRLSRALSEEGLGRLLDGGEVGQVQVQVDEVTGRGGMMLRAQVHDGGIGFGLRTCGQVDLCVLWITTC
jgi:hypothetical protein